MAPRNGYNNVQYPSVECHLWDPIELRFQFRDIRDVRHPIGGATWESFLFSRLTIWPSQNGILNFFRKFFMGGFHQFHQCHQFHQFHPLFNGSWQQTITIPFSDSGSVWLQDWAVWDGGYQAVASMLGLHEFKTALVVKRRNKPPA